MFLVAHSELRYVSFNLWIKLGCFGFFIEIALSFCQWASRLWTWSFRIGNCSVISIHLSNSHNNWAIWSVTTAMSSQNSPNCKKKQTQRILDFQVVRVKGFLVLLDKEADRTLTHSPVNKFKARIVSMVLK